MAVSSTSPDIALLRSSVTDILGGQAQATEAQANATAQQYAAEGAGVEQGAYQTAADIARQNAQLEQVSGQIEQAQQQREAAQTIGTQRAGFATAGFGKSGSALAAVTAATRQGLFANQIIGTQTQLNTGAQLEQLNAAEMEAGAAGVKQQAATALGGAYTTEATAATQRTQSETQALLGYLASVGAIGGTPTNPQAGGSMTPAAGVTLASLSAGGVPGAPNIPMPKWQQVGGTWQYGGTATSPQTMATIGSPGFGNPLAMTGNPLAMTVI